ncbi:MAG: hypothetical protein ACK42D_02530 [Candidatus Paceibacteria bacterium]
MNPIYSSTTVTSTTTVPTVGFDYLTPLLQFLFGETGIFTSISVAGAADFFQVLWMIIVVVGYCVAFFFLYLYIYASIGIGKMTAIETERVKTHEKAFAMKREGTIQSSRFTEVREHIESDNPNDWKHAIIEADIILDKALKQLGYAGASLGERLRSITPTMLGSIDDAWEAHKVRNHIAHGGPDFVLTHKIAKDTIIRYERVLGELGLL